VRQAQTLTNLDEAYAHRMAVLSMNQFGILMRGINPKLVEASTELELAERGWQHRGIVWLPSHMVHTDTQLIKNKQMTSDSLSAWLARKMNATQLVIVDSFTKTDDVIGAQSLADARVTDAFFPEMLSEAKQENSLNTWLLDKQFFHLFNDAFDTGILSQFAAQVTH
jgi:5-(aminomethyl)-3-furanmethanol phosphate kinase